MQTKTPPCFINKSKPWIGCAVFVLIVFLVLQFIRICLYPMNEIIENWQDFYPLERESVDMLIVGSSHAFSSFDSDRISEATGKNTYILAGYSQTAVQSYFYVKEALRYHSPDAIVLEAFSLNDNEFYRAEGDRDWRKDSAVDGMRFGPIKLQAIYEQYLPENRAYALFPIGRYHKNWQDGAMIYENLIHYSHYLIDGKFQFNCYHPSFTSMSEETERQYAEMEESNEPYVISPSNQAYFKKLAALCREEGIALYVITAPMYDVYLEKSHDENRRAAVEALTASEGVPYFDCNLYYDAIGLTAQDFEDLFTDFHHMNYSGAEKTTAYLLEQGIPPFTAQK